MTEHNARPHTAVPRQSRGALDPPQVRHIHLDLELRTMNAEAPTIDTGLTWAPNLETGDARMDETHEEYAYPPELFENQFVILKDDQSLKRTQLGRVEGDRVVPLDYKKSKPYGIIPRNVGQYFLQEALMQSAEIKIV